MAINDRLGNLILRKVFGLITYYFIVVFALSLLCVANTYLSTWLILSNRKGYAYVTEKLHKDRGSEK